MTGKTKIKRLEAALRETEAALREALHWVPEPVRVYVEANLKKRG